MPQRFTGGFESSNNFVVFELSKLQAVFYGLVRLARSKFRNRAEKVSHFFVKVVSTADLRVGIHYGTPVQGPS